MKIAVLGLWHLGLVTAGCLARIGHNVTGFDDSEQLVSDLGNGHLPVFEPGLVEVVRAELASGRLAFENDVAKIPSDCQVLWVAIDTPVDDNDLGDSEGVVKAILRALGFVPDGTLVIISSQLPAGSTRRIESEVTSWNHPRGLRFSYSPENLRLGSAIEVFTHPDRLVVGVGKFEDRSRFAAVFESITNNIEWMSIESAEVTKHAINAFLAMSVAFANEVAAVCEFVGADAREVEHALRSDRRIGKHAYISAGEAFAGGTLARDVQYLRQIAAANNFDSTLITAIKLSNDLHRGWVKARLQSLVAHLDGCTVTVCGLAYKTGTDTLRRSASVEMCDWLLERGASLRIFDPVVSELPPRWDNRVTRQQDIQSALRNTDVLIIGSSVPRLVGNYEVQISPPNLSKMIVLDPGRRCGELEALPDVRYFAVGKSHSSLKADRD